MTVVTTFGSEKFDTEIQLFLTRLQCQKQLKMKNLIKNNIIILKSVLKESYT